MKTSSDKLGLKQLVLNLIHVYLYRINRKAKEDVEICGVYIKKNMDIIFSPFALHMSPDYWEDPLTFNPERFVFLLSPGYFCFKL